MNDFVDFCVGFNGRNSDVLSRVCFGSMLLHCDLSRALMHVVDNGIPSDTKIPQLMLDQLPNHRLYRIYENWEPAAVYGRYHTDSMIPQFEMCRWIVDNCGTCQWCVISDFDIIFKGDILSYMREHMRDDVGIIGSHGRGKDEFGENNVRHTQVTPLFAINRNAFKKRRVGFNGGRQNITPSWVKYPMGTACDLGILLAEDLEDLGYRWVKFLPEPEMEPYFHNMGGGGSYHSKAEFDSMRERASDLCMKNSWGVDPELYKIWKEYAHLRTN